MGAEPGSRTDDDGGRDATLTCFHTLLLEVRAAAEVVLTVAVTPASGRLHLLQLEAPPLAGASGGVPLRTNWQGARGGSVKTSRSACPIMGHRLYFDTRNGFKLGRQLIVTRLP